jgi:hypothetical protein
MLAKVVQYMEWGEANLEHIFSGANYIRVHNNNFLKIKRNYQNL